MSPHKRRRSSRSSRRGSRRYGNSASGLHWRDPRAWSNESGHGSTWQCETVDYGLADARGRSIGGYATIDHGSNFRNKDAFYLSVRATRDGQSFGALPRPTEYKTLELAKAGAAKKIAEAQKRYAKLVEKGVGRQYERR